jgi:hypothetical protein
MATRNTVVLRGNERIYGGGQRAWRSVVYEPTARYPNYRIMFKAQDDAGMWEWQTRTAVTEEEARVLFRQVERALDAFEPAPAKQRELMASDLSPAQVGTPPCARNESGLDERRTVAVR